MTTDLEKEREALRAALKLALEYWEHRQQRYKNRSPAWVTAARAALAAPAAPSDTLDMSLQARLADAEADVARLHADKIALLERYVFVPAPQEDRQIARIVNELRDIAQKYGHTEQLRDRISQYIVPVLKSMSSTPQEQPSDEDIVYQIKLPGSSESTWQDASRYAYDITPSQKRRMLSRYGAAPQGGEVAEPAGIVRWRNAGATVDWNGRPPDDGELIYATPQPAGRDAREVPLIARSLAEWHEDDGPVMWWAWCGHEWAGEPAWCGQPTDSDWPGYHTHWTPHTPFPATLTTQGSIHD